MKRLRIAMDEALLVRLDTDDEVRRDGRSAVIRRAVAEYLENTGRYTIAESYRSVTEMRSGWAWRAAFVSASWMVR